MTKEKRAKRKAYLRTLDQKSKIKARRDRPDRKAKTSARMKLKYKDIEHRTKQRIYEKTLRESLRQQILEHYGNKCHCCGETRKEFLSIDHINGGGHKHRKRVGKGLAFYKWFVKNNFPDGFRILCMNCNWAIGRFGYCPHQKELEEVNRHI